MKKLYLFMFLTLMIFYVSAQERNYNYVAPKYQEAVKTVKSEVAQSKGVKVMLLDESFETAVPPTGWTKQSPDGGTGWNRQTVGTTPIPGWTGGTVTAPDGGGNAIAYCTWSTGGASSNDQWLITPQLSVSSGDELSFYITNFFTNYADAVEVKLSTTTAQTSAFTVSLGTISWPGGGSGPDEWTMYTYDLSAYDGQDVYIGFREVVANNSTDGAAIGIDLVKIGSPAALDAGIVDIDLPPIFGTGLLDIAGTVQNFGSDNIISFDVVYTVNGTDVSSVFSVSGIDIPYGGTYAFTHDVQYDFATAGTYNVEVEISNVNSGTDENLANNVLDIDVEAAEGVVQRRPLNEVFTSSTCGYCPDDNANIDAITLDPSNIDHCTLIKYQVSWPGDGDPYQTPMAADRVAFYGISGVPAFFVDANDDAGDTYTQADLDDYASIPAFIEIEGEHTVVGDQVEVDVTITPNANFTGVCHVVVVEKETTGNVGSNGETEFHNVMMAMLPSSAGTNVNLVAGTPYTFSVSKDMSDTFVEEMFDLEVVMFLQNPTTKEVMQSNYSVLNNVGSDLIVTGVGVTNDPVDCVYSDASEIAVTLLNFGSDDITEFEVSYTVDGGAPVVENVTYTIPAGEEYVYVFPTTADLSGIGIHEIVANASFTSDIYTENNEASTTVISGDDIINVSITLDNYPSETSWDIVDVASGVVVAEGSGYTQVGGSVSVDACVLSNACYEFVIYDAAGDGICCSYGTGSYTVTRGGVEVASGGSFGASESTEIAIQLDIELDDLEFCPGEVVAFVPAGIGEYDIDPATIDNMTAGTTTVTYTMAEGTDCEVSETFDVTILNGEIDIVEDDITVCAGETITFPAGDGVFDPVSVDNTIPGTTTVTYTLNGGLTCEVGTTFDVIVKNNSIDITLEDIVICTGETIEFVTGGIGSFDVEASSIDNNAVGTTTVTYTVAESATQCEVSETFDVTVVDATMDITADDITICEGEVITFPTGGAGTFSPASVANDVVAVTTVTYTLNEGMTCESTLTFDVTVNEVPEAVITLGAGYELSTTSTDNVQWYLNSNIIDGATEQTYVCAEDGDYYAIISTENCSAQSNTISVTGTIVNIVNAEGLNVFPNPANDKLYIEFGEYSQIDVKIIDCTGKVIMNENLSSGQFVDVSALASGIYFVDVKNAENKGGMYKIIIE